MQLLSHAADSPLILITTPRRNEMKNQLCAEAYFSNLNVFLQTLSHRCKDEASSRALLHHTQVMVNAFSRHLDARHC